MSAIPLDGLQLKALSEALADRLVGTRLGAASMPDRHTVQLAFGRAGASLLLSIDPAANQVAVLPAPSRSQAPLRHPFRDLLQARLAGGTVEAVRVPLGERELAIAVRSRNRIGDPTELLLVAELFGSRADLLLVEQGEVVDGLRRLRHEPHAPFLLLGPAVHADHPGMGGPPLPLREYHHLSAADPQAADAFWQQAWSQPGRYQPVAVAGLKPPFYPLPLSHLPPPQAAVPDLLAAVSEHVSAERQRERTEAVRTRRLAVLDKTLAHLQRQAQDLTSAIEESRRAAPLRRRAEALLSVVTQLAPGDSEFSYTDWSDGTQHTVPLDPALSPAANAEAWFKEARRMAARAARARELLPALRSRLAATQAERAAVATAATLPDTAGATGGASSAHKAAAPRPYHTFRTPDGHQVRVGRNQAGNELLLRLARPSDLWLHAHGIAGSHVILSAQGGVGATDKEAAAALAAYFSKGRQSRTVAVDCTARRHVRKPAKAPPGFVLFDHQETLDASPSGPLLQFLLDQMAPDA